MQMVTLSNVFSVLNMDMLLSAQPSILSMYL